MTVKTLDTLFRRILQDVYYAEKEILKAVPRLAARATLADLKASMIRLRETTEKRIKRVESIFGHLKTEAAPHKSTAIDGILAEAEALARDIPDADTRDAGLVASLQEIEHYEINRYGTLLSWAGQLGHKDVVASLRECLTEAKAVDRSLTEMAETRVNKLAAA